MERDVECTPTCTWAPWTETASVLAFYLYHPGTPASYLGNCQGGFFLSADRTALPPLQALSVTTLFVPVSGGLAVFFESMNSESMSLGGICLHSSASMLPQEKTEQPCPSFKCISADSSACAVTYEISYQQTTTGAVGKNLPADAGDTRFDLWVGKIPWRRERLSTPVFLPGESHGQRSLTGLQSMGSQRVGHN